MGLKLVGWTRGVWDTDNPNPDVLFLRATKRPRRIEVLLLHDGDDVRKGSLNRENMLKALPRIIDFYREKGYKFYKLDELPGFQKES